jgi:hypothetical protein
MALAAAVLAVSAQTTTAPAGQRSFAKISQALSEPGGYFDTDNLISNERSFLHVTPALRVPALAGGVYLGVGPDQNFSYIAHARPSLAIIVDIRRDNLLLHLLFKALFQLAPTRIEYLSLLTGRAPPAAADVWTARPVRDVIAAIDRAAPLGADRLAALDQRLAATIDAFGMALTPEDHRTIVRFHRRFVDDGLSLQFNSTGRAPQFNYPTYRDLLLETDRAGTPRSFMAIEADYQFVRSLQGRDLVVPIVGDLAGPQALAAVARFLSDRKAQVSAFYVSNVEFYLFRQGSFARFVNNVARMPRRDGSVIIRSAFNGAPTVPGYNSASMTQSIQALVDGYAAGRFRQYWDLISDSR